MNLSTQRLSQVNIPRLKSVSWFFKTMKFCFSIEITIRGRGVVSELIRPLSKQLFISCFCSRVYSYQFCLCYITGARQCDNSADFIY